MCGARDVTDAGAAAWARATPGLAVLGAAWVPGVGDETAAALGDVCGRLVSLSLHGNAGGVTDGGIDAVARGCPGLTALDVTAAVGVTRRLDKAVMRALFPGVTVWRLQR
jgi:hypothetical protein